MSKKKQIGCITLVASATRWTLIMVPCSDAVAMYIPFEERTNADNGELWASICMLIR